MTLYIKDIQCSDMRYQQCCNLNELSDSHLLKDRDINVFRRIFSLEGVVMNRLCHKQMHLETMAALLEKYPKLRRGSGMIIYTKTQTHNTFFDDNWLGKIAVECGLSHWRYFTLSMNHCASGLSAVNLACHMHENGYHFPVIILSGEKSFSASFNRMPVGLLGEISTACLLSSEEGVWEIRDTKIEHIHRFYKNQDEMTQQERSELRTLFFEELDRFLARFSDANKEPDSVIPYNLNIPLLKRVAQARGWTSIIDLSQISRMGHLWCSDIFHHLSIKKNEPSHQTVMAFSAGMGITLSAISLVKSH
ncbi:hypothetical protein [Lonsdalea quercina]|uniref:hypothetical protein n=1 Tax=Lonsdalea quercina TaxID=71657 RepID=UPI0012690724|nr:hypothetical protein [Lonsdalea quercina]